MVSKDVSKEVKPEEEVTKDIADELGALTVPHKHHQYVASR